MGKKVSSDVNIVYKALLAVALVMLLVMINQMDRLGDSSLMIALLFVSVVFAILIAAMRPKPSKKRN